MPLYDLECLDCGARFEALVRSSNEPKCPQCDSGNLERLLSMFAVNSQGTRQSHLQSARRQGAKAQRDKAIAEHEQVHKNLEH
jgi:putative FmdB family regulatory protein